DAQKIYPVCISGARATPEEDCGGPLAYMELVRHHRLNPPLNELSLIADVLKRVVEVKETDDRTVREVIGDGDELREAVDRLEAYNRFRPERFDRREVNRQLRLYATGQPVERQER